MCFNLMPARPSEVWNKPVLESEHFLVLPSLGSLVLGWVLVIPKQHSLCIGALPQSLFPEFQRVKEQTVKLIASQFGVPCLFEHGPSSAGLKVGCSVDHAHLHVVPFSGDLTRLTASFMPDGAGWRPADVQACINAFSVGENYLYFEQPLGTGFISVHPAFGSQVFRKAIALHLGKPHEFDWREYPNHSAIQATVQALAPRNHMEMQIGANNGL
jgi:diadenosine tetraphosphate (Ap4A) HIT family hydrolase